MLDNKTEQEVLMTFLLKDVAQTAIKGLNSVDAERLIGELSDGYHSFDELYEFRKLYNAALFNEWAKQGKYNVHKSYRHNDNELCFGGGWFIVVAILPTGQISNHYRNEDWHLFQCEVAGKAIYEFDGHTSKDVASRLKTLINNYDL